MEPKKLSACLLSQASVTILSLFACSTLGAGDAAAAGYNVTISTGATSNGSISGCVFTPSGNNAVLNYSDLQTSLASCSTEVTTGSGGSQSGNITVAAGVTWSSSSTLTLDARKSIIVNASVAASGYGGLTLTPADGDSTGTLSFGSSGDATFAQTSSVLTISGTQYTLVTSVSQLASAVAGNDTGHIALANSYDASGDGTYSSAPVSTTLYGTFEGLGNTISNLSISDSSTSDSVGLFDTLAVTGVHVGTIRDVVLSSATVTASGADVGGIVGQTQSGTVVTNDTITALSLTANGASVPDVGGMVGYNGGTVNNALVEGSSSLEMSGPMGGDTGENLGGVVGHNDSTATVSNSSVTSATVLSQDNKGTIRVGGLAGYNLGFISSSSSAAGVTSTSENSLSIIRAGGLVGFNYGGTIQGSTASGAVSGSGDGSVGGFFGGLAGDNENSGLISASSATGNVTGDNASGTVGTVVGGLVGWNGTSSTIEGAGGNWSYASGNVSGGSGAFAGGLVGNNTGTVIKYTYATGLVSATGGGNAGGLVGGNGSSSTIKYSYYEPASTTATLVQVGNSGVYVTAAGGLVGQNNGTILDSWVNNFLSSGNGSQPLISGGNGAYVGGLAGYNDGSITNAYSLLENNLAVSIEGGTSSPVGGLIGVNDTAGTVTAAYSNGAPSGGTGSDVAGSVGYDESYNGSTSGFTDVYWDTTASGQSCGAENVCNDPGITGLTTAQLQSTLPSGFSSPWAQNINLYDGYPYLSVGSPPRGAKGHKKTGAPKNGSTRPGQANPVNALRAPRRY